MTYKTGEDAPANGKYVFESYIDADTTVPEPTANEEEILLTRGERFPHYDRGLRASACNAHVTPPS